MKTLKFALIAVGGLAVAAAVFTGTKALAFPAEVIKDTGCVVRDGAGVQYVDDDCRVHIVIKYDDFGDLQFVQYQDKGRIPDGATRPKKAIKTETFFSCGGCLFEGTYTETITPSGRYTSRGPN